jgi:ribosomal protein L29
MAQHARTEPTLYERDYAAWLEEQARLARAGKAAALDLANLAEELEDMGRGERRALESQLTRLLMHLLKWRYQASHRGGSWHLTIREARRAIRRLLSDSPSLRPHLAAVLDACYQSARGDAAAQTGLPLTTFPVACPFTRDWVLNTEELP